MPFSPAGCSAEANLRAALVLLRALQHSGLRQLVLCPGSRSAPLAVAAGLLAAPPGGLELITAIDERSAAFLITNAEGGALHLEHLRTRANDFDPLIRDRLLAGALLPAAWVLRARRVRDRFAREVAEVFGRFDVLLAAATPGPATPIGAETMRIRDRELPARPNTGLLTQPISCIGLPVCTVPVWSDSPLPVGVQIIVAPWREDLALRVAAHLEAQGLARAPVAELAAEIGRAHV